MQTIVHPIGDNASCGRCVPITRLEAWKTGLVLLLQGGLPLADGPSGLTD